MIAQKHTESQMNNSEMESWFDDVIAQIKTDRFQLETQTASVEKVEIYNDFIDNNTDKIFDRFSVGYRMHYISKVVIDYIKELTTRLKTSIKDIKIALDFSNNKLLVWAVIPTKNEDYYEQALILSEAKVNAKYFNNGFCITSTIVNLEDDLSIPDQYKLLTN
ncbi:MAG: hypothetical protein RJA25_1145 [Bacteroidota bacterium]|jgi:hypothetical protein